MIEAKEKLKRRHRRIRSKISGTPEVPRLFVFRSNKHIYAQLIDDNKGITLTSASDFDIKTKTGLTKTQKAHQVGLILGDKIKSLKLTNQIVFDKGPYAFHGRIQALLEAVRQKGIKI